MASIIKSDNGVSSGVTGIVQIADSSGQLSLQTTTSSGTATTAVTVDNAQNVGVGVTPNAWGTYSGIIDLKGNGSVAAFNQSVLMAANAYYNGTNFIYKATTSAGYYQIAGNQFQWYTAPSGTAGNAITFTQAMTLDASGNFLVGQTTQSYSTVGFSVLGSGSGSNNGTVNSCLSVSTNAASSYNLYSTGAGAFRFYVDMGGYVHATSITITAISDERLKENVREIDTGLSTIMALKPRRYDWKEGKGLDKKNAAGFIAQEFEQVFPDSVGTSKAGEDGIEYKNINYEELIPTLTKAIQELSAQVTSLQATVETQATTIATLQNKIGA